MRRWLWGDGRPQFAKVYRNGKKGEVSDVDGGIITVVGKLQRVKLSWGVEDGASKGIKVG